MSIDRRRSPRAEILDRIHGHVISLNVEVTILNMSLVGMSLQTPFEFPEGAIHEFRLTLGDGSPTVIRGRVVRCRRQIEADGSTVFVSGVQFLDEDPPEGEGPIGGLMDKIR